MIQPPPLVPPALDANEREMLLGFLDFYRATLVRKAAGLRPEELARPLPPSTLTLGGLLKHMALVEDDWFTSDMAGRDLPEPWASVDWDSDRDWELNSAKNDIPEELLALFEAACARSRAVVQSCESLDQRSVKTSGKGNHFTLRWILVHMIEEYARHCGHADFLREAIDGQRGS
ncbi:MAG TPA: DinB family protein [Acidimicrobiales bacterium]|nr:DinB family protein [Acidimicrobiales bacterium]